jgi:6-phosphogluconolactonase
MQADFSGLVYVGSYTQGGEDGIHVFHMDPTTGALTLVGTTGGPPNPSFLAISPNRRILVAVNETSQFDGQPGGGVSSYTINPATGALTLLNSQPTHGIAPCYISFDHSGQWVLTANYGGASLVTFPLGQDGQLGPAAGTAHHQMLRPSADPARQDTSHPHSIIPDPTGRLFLAADLGLDKVFIYKMDASGQLIPNSVPYISSRQGAGPRHMAFTPIDQLFYAFYVINELDSSVAVYQYTPGPGMITELEVVSTLPKELRFNIDSTAADLHISPNGKFLYGSNRGHDSLAVFAIHPANGTLSLQGHVSTGGKTPRNFGIDPSGTFLLAANQDSDTLVSFRIDPATGIPAPTGHITELPKPVCVQFF